jgi:hypothetical protein
MFRSGGKAVGLAAGFGFAAGLSAAGPMALFLIAVLLGVAAQ